MKLFAKFEDFDLRLAPLTHQQNHNNNHHVFVIVSVFDRRNAPDLSGYDYDYDYKHIVIFDLRNTSDLPGPHDHYYHDSQ